MSSTRGHGESFASLFEQSSSAKGGQRRYHVGESVDVTIVAIARDAVFADLGGKQEGFFERPELCDPDGNLRVEVGSTVSAVVGSIDKATGQVRLQPTVIRRADADIGVARASGGAAGESGPLLVEGGRVKGKVTGVERYGVFVQITGTSGRSGRGLVPASETGTSRGADLKKHFSLGQEVEAKILNIDETGKIRLSVSALGADAERGDYDAYKAGQAQPEAAGAGGAEGQAAAAVGGKGGAGKAKEKPKKPEPRGFGTLGDILPRVAPKPEAPVAAAAVGGKAAGAKGAAAPKGPRTMVTGAGKR